MESHPSERLYDAIVRGAHPSKTAKGEAAKVVVAQKWASPQQILNHTFTFGFQQSTMNGTTVTLVTLE